MSELVKPITRMAYEHTPTGNIYMVWGVTGQLLDKNFTEVNPIVVMTDLSNPDNAVYYPLSKFFDVNPATQQKRFELVTPVNAKVKK